MLYLTCTTITSVDLAYYRVSRAKDWVSVDCSTRYASTIMLLLLSAENVPIYLKDTVCHVVFSISYVSFTKFSF